MYEYLVIFIFIIDKQSVKQLIGLYENNKQQKKQVQFEKKNESSDVVEGTVKEKVAFYEKKRNSSSSSSERQSKKSEINLENQEGIEQENIQDKDAYDPQGGGGEQSQKEENNLASSKNGIGYEEQKKEEPPPQLPPNSGSLIVDATACPQDIAYPTDLNLINDAREKSEELTDILYYLAKAADSSKVKPRTYREIARKEYLKVA